jgi:transketolase
MTQPMSPPVFDRLPVCGGRPAADQVAHLARVARAVRRRDAQMIHQAGLGHIGGDFSVTDILVSLYFAVLDFDPARPGDPERDRLVLSKGHAAGSLYVTLAALGLLPAAELTTFMAPLSRLNGHPSRTKLPGVEASTGPLGHGLPVAVGLALAAQLDGSPRRTFVIVGDGELEEGSNWEAMMVAAHHRLANLTVIADRNRLQQGATTASTTALASVQAKASAFGMAVERVDGHDLAQLVEVLGRRGADLPRFIIADTIKGHPISFMSGNVIWHHKVPDAGELAQILAELEES